MLKSQKRANKKWDKSHPKLTRLYNERSNAKRYIKDENNPKYLKKFLVMIKNKLNKL